MRSSASFWQKKCTLTGTKSHPDLCIRITNLYSLSVEKYFWCFSKHKKHTIFFICSAEKLHQQKKLFPHFFFVFYSFTAYKVEKNENKNQHQKYRQTKCCEMYSIWNEVLTPYISVFLSHVHSSICTSSKN